MLLKVIVVVYLQRRLLQDINGAEGAISFIFIFRLQSLISIIHNSFDQKIAYLSNQNLLEPLTKIDKLSVPQLSICHDSVVELSIHIKSYDSENLRGIVKKYQNEWWPRLQNLSNLSLVQTKR